jgi:hypothetical protein
MQLEGTSYLIRDVAPLDAVMDSNAGSHRHIDSNFEYEPARQSVAAAAMDLGRYRTEKDRTFYPSETVSFFCRHLSGSIEVTDPGEEKNTSSFLFCNGGARHVLHARVENSTRCPQVYGQNA